MVNIYNNSQPPMDSPPVVCVTTQIQGIGWQVLCLLFLSRTLGVRISQVQAHDLALTIFKLSQRCVVFSGCGE